MRFKTFEDILNAIEDLGNVQIEYFVLIYHDFWLFVQKKKFGLNFLYYIFD